MAAANKLELVVEVQTDQGNRAVTDFNARLSSIERTAVQVAKTTSTGLDSMTASIVKGAAAGNIIADVFMRVVDFARQMAREVIQAATGVEKFTVILNTMGKARGLDPAAMDRYVEGIKKVGLTTNQAQQFIARFMETGLGVQKGNPLAQVAKALGVVNGIDPNEAGARLLNAIESGQSRGLRQMGVYVDLATKIKNADLEMQLTHNRTLTEQEREEVAYQAIIKATKDIVEAKSAAESTAEEKQRALARAIEETKEKLGEKLLPDYKKFLDLLLQGTDWIKQHTEAVKSLATALLAAGAAYKGISFVSQFSKSAGAAAAGNVAGTVAGAAAAQAAPLLYTASGTVWKGAAAEAATAGGAGLLAQAGGAIKGMFSAALAFITAPAVLAAIAAAVWAVAAKVGMDALLKTSLLGGNIRTGQTAADIAREKDAYENSIAMARALQNRPGGVLAIRQTGQAKPNADQAAAQEAADRARTEALERALEVKQKSAEADRASKDYLAQAREALLTVGDDAQQTIDQIIEKAKVKEAKWIEDHTTVIEKGVVSHFKLSAEARKNIEQATDLEIEAGRRELMRKRQKSEDEWAKHRQELALHVSEFEEKREDMAYQAAQRRLGYERDEAIRQLEAQDAQTLPKKLVATQKQAEIEAAFAKQRADNEIAHLQRVQDLKQRFFAADTEILLGNMRLEMQASRLYTEPEIQKRLGELKSIRDQQMAQIGEETQAAIQTAREGGDETAKAARENATIKQAELIRNQQRQIFDSLKQQAGSVFDALLQKGQSIWSALGNSLKTAVLTAIKDIVSSRVAAMLMQLFTGTRVGFEQGSGVLGPLGVGATPVFGGAGGLGAVLPIIGMGGLGGGTFGGGYQGGGVFSLGGGSPLAQAASMVLVPTSNGGAVAVPASGGRFGGVGSIGGFGSMFSGFKGMLTNIGNLGQHTVPMGSMGGTATTSGGGIYGATGGAMLLGGATLAMMGLQRGGLSGLGMDVAGGALIGAKFGGPIGAAIGAGIGAVAGIARLFVKSATEKARQKIKAAYGVDITSKDVLQQVVDIAKSRYGGNLDMAIRAKEVIDIVRLYSQMTGQNPDGSLPAQMQAGNLMESSGSLYQLPNMQNGMPLSSAGGLLPTLGLDRVSAGLATGGGSTVIQLDGPATTALLRGEAVNAIHSSPSVVQGATIKATKANVGRRSMVALQLSPGTLTS